MIWIILIAIIAGYILWKFNSDKKEVQYRNISLGGMTQLFPEFVAYFEMNNFKLVEDSGTKLIYKKALTNNPPYNTFLFIGVESKFTNIAFGYIIKGNGEKIKGLQFEFRKNFRTEEVEMIIRKIIGDFQLNGHI